MTDGSKTKAEEIFDRLGAIEGKIDGMRTDLTDIKDCQTDQQKDIDELKKARDKQSGATAIIGFIVGVLGLSGILQLIGWHR